MNILIIGGGLVGNNLYSFLSKKNQYNCHISSISKKIGVDYWNDDDLSLFCEDNKIDVIVNCAGFTGTPNVDECENRKMECWKMNVVLPSRLEKFCKTKEIKFIHVSSGCIYSGYDKKYNETDDPNFGLYDQSSFYSKTKHAYETINDYGSILRIRMPLIDLKNNRDYLFKILKYDNLINYLNSKTYLLTLFQFIDLIIDKQLINEIGIVNVVNNNPLKTDSVITVMKSYNFENKNWNFVNIEDLKITAPRSNCVLDCNKFLNILNKYDPDQKVVNILSEFEVLHEILTKASNE